VASVADARQLFDRYRAANDHAARDALVERFLPLATRLARRYASGGEPLGDLVQVASIGLLKAIERFDPGRATAFSTFAVPTITGELKRHFRDKAWSVRVPRDLQELARRVDRTSDLLTHRLGRAPTASELAHHLGMPVAQVLEGREAAAAYRAESLDGCSDSDGCHALDTLGSDDPGYRQAEYRATLERMMATLSERDREILRLRFADDLTQAEIGRRIGLSQMHVSRVLRRAIARLREAAESGGQPA
jgi:RNA polymerase sigma-B factor